MVNPREAITRRITDAGLIAIIRTDSSDGLLETCRALAAGGVSVIEITMTTPGALDAINAASGELGDSGLMGVGSVLDGDTARRAVDAGAQFVISPVLKPDVIDAAHELGKPVVPGCFTPTEILTATELGADLVKVFPAAHFGPRFFYDVLAPMPHLKLVPTGGVNLDTIADWLAAGAAALGVGSSMINRNLVRDRQWDILTAVAQRYADAVNALRG